MVIARLSLRDSRGDLVHAATFFNSIASAKEKLHSFILTACDGYGGFEESEGLPQNVKDKVDVHLLDGLNQGEEEITYDIDEDTLQVIRVYKAEEGHVLMFESDVA